MRNENNDFGWVVALARELRIFVNEGVPTWNSFWLPAKENAMQVEIVIASTMRYIVFVKRLERDKGIIGMLVVVWFVRMSVVY